MNRRQKSIIYDFIFVVVIIVLAVVGLVNLKDYVNRAEAMRAMEHLGRVVLGYRQAYGAAPAEYYVDEVRKDLEGSARLGKLVYRARWIEFGATGDEVLAYTQKRYSSVLGDGYIVLRLDGRVGWMKKNEFEMLLDSQQSVEEKRLSPEEL
jgi:hypothetical protein